MSHENTVCAINQTAADALAGWRQQVDQGALTPFAGAQQIVRRLGAQFNSDGDCEIGFWYPGIPDHAGPDDLYLEVITPSEPLDFRTDRQSLAVTVEQVPVVQDGDFIWTVVRNMRPGKRDQAGSFYWLRYRDHNGDWQTVRDPLAHSLPFGASSPAEAYDLGQLHDGRSDLDYFERLDGTEGSDGLITQTAPANILQLHPGTSTGPGTLEALAAQFGAIAEKQRRNEPLTPAEQCYIGYDAVQLMPLEPTIEFEAGTDFWHLDRDQSTLTLHTPDMTNWGYDVMTLGSPAVATTVLGSGRPDELVDLISTLHTMPEQPMRVIFDIVYGHTDNQTPAYMNDIYFSGDNMYGKNLNYRHPMVRATLLEMQRRKSNFGVDGLRVDGAQDFKIWDPVAEQLYHDDEYLQLMSDLPVEVGTARYRPWMIFEDGRPWPRDDWELASTYREVTRQQPDVAQWGPLTFAHNTPYLFTFWLSKWWRIREIAEVGSHWITGCANHDTLRRGTQVGPAERINTYLGATLPDIFRKAYDNPAAHLLDYIMMPGIPMEFINANVRAPWSFMRNIDDRYGVKVMAEEAHFTEWAIRDNDYEQPVHFERLKARGFRSRQQLQGFLESLLAFVEVTDYDLGAMVRLLATTEDDYATLAPDVTTLKGIARDWMDDVHDYCNVQHWTDRLDADSRQWFLEVRNFRRQHPSLRDNLGPDDYFDYLHPSEGAVVFVGRRRLRDSGTELLFIANMAGAPRELTPCELDIPGLSGDDWQVLFRTQGLSHADFTMPLYLNDSEGVVFQRAVG